jgi:large subunit ribosomal protein L3
MSLSNSLGLLGRKVGMMRLFTDDGTQFPSRWWMCPTTA